MVLRLRVPAPGNWEMAKCKDAIQTGEDSFFDEDEDDAIEFCNDHGTCPIRDECLIFALTNNEKSGVWGGTSELDRKALRKRWPLEQRGRDTVPRPEWRWYPSGEPQSWFDPEELKRELQRELEAEDE